MVACGLGRETLRFDFEKTKSKVVFGLELREKMESWRCWCAVVVERKTERERAREREEHFDFAKRGKTRDGGSLNFLESISSFSFKWFKVRLDTVEN